MRCIPVEAGLAGASTFRALSLHSTPEEYLAFRQAVMQRTSGAPMVQLWSKMMGSAKTLKELHGIVDFPAAPKREASEQTEVAQASLRKGLELIRAASLRELADSSESLSALAESWSDEDLNGVNRAILKHVRSAALLAAIRQTALLERAPEEIAARTELQAWANELQRRGVSGARKKLGAVFYVPALTQIRKGLGCLASLVRIGRR